MRLLLIGNSDGIGLALTRQLLARGDEISSLSRSPMPVDDEHPSLRHRTLDVLDDDYQATLEDMINSEGPFDACFFCTGTGSGLELPDTSREADIVEINFTAMVRCFSALIPGWIERGQGHFVGLSSLADDIYNPGAPSYSASKAGFSNYLIAMAHALRPKGVHVTNVRFGFVDTKMAQAEYKPLMITPDEAARRLIRVLDSRPMQLSTPKLAGALIRVGRWWQNLTTWLR